MCEIMGQWFLMDELRLVEAGVGGIAYQDLARQGSRERGYRDVLVPCPDRQYPPPQRPSTFIFIDHEKCFALLRLHSPSHELRTTYVLLYFQNRRTAMQRLLFQQAEVTQVR